ncbi:unnamed protein product (macronuclear) [Paramecium tetraurelia]|uniref:Transmembrane protein n=1 Tax=Paramecium tetraurelia TaxID=5888 RepID=A0EBN1_PARTE|nr:uncharacterized protein GSPATT00025432001 [Paramecium tetraurelia]CAK92698.1 unnamed protein product [Paramecium tetraurelia]|eukprot:XP_001460095.1 hypothetical protein (macronuclear) [Paramecium tetraurelia strain d4-2]
MNKPIYREYQNHRGDNEDPNTTKMVQITDDNSLNRINDTLKDSINENNKYGVQNIFSPSDSIKDKKELKDESSSDPKNTQFAIQNITESDKLIEINTTDHGDKEEFSRFQKGMLSLQTIKYQKKRIQSRNPKYVQKEKKKKEINWDSDAMRRWKVSVNIVLFVLSLLRGIKHRRQEGNKITQSQDVERNQNIKSNFRLKKFGLTILKLFVGLSLALLISVLIFPFILISDLFLRIYTYINLYVRYALSHEYLFYKFILLIQLYMYVIAIAIAIITNLYQSIITSVELIYNIVGTVQNNISDLSSLLFQTIQNPFSKQK